MTDQDFAERIRNQREREVERFNLGRAGSLPSPFFAAVVGVTFVDGYPQNLYALEAASLDVIAFGDERLAAVIIRNHDNPYDSNACEEHVPAHGDAAMVGHPPRPIAARLAAELDSGIEWQAEVECVRISPDNPANPGLTVTLRRIT